MAGGHKSIYYSVMTLLVHSGRHRQNNTHQCLHPSVVLITLEGVRVMWWLSILWWLLYVTCSRVYVCYSVYIDCVNFQHEGTNIVKLQLRMSLYDSTYKQFFGRTWIGPFTDVKRGSKVAYNQVLVTIRSNIWSLYIVVICRVLKYICIQSSATFVVVCCMLW